MRYVIRQKWLAVRPRFTIRDMEGRERYHVQGRFFSIGARLDISDVSGQPVAHIVQRLLRLRPTFEIHQNGSLSAQVRKHLFCFLGTKFDIETVSGGFLRIEGDLLAHEYALLRDGQRVAGISKKWLSIADTYVIDVAQGEDDVLLLAAAIVIDMVCHRNN